MAPKYWNTRSPNEKDDAGDAFELLQQRRTGQTSSLEPIKSTDDDWSIIPTRRLLPKPLALRSTTHTVRILFWTGLLVLLIITGLGVLAALLHGFLPYTSYVEADKLYTSVSCDLNYKQESKIQSAFTIDLRGAAHLTFTQARAIDVLWQLFIGAGGRFAMAWISYKVFMDGLTRLVEQSPVPYSLYASLTFSTTSLLTVWYSFKAIYHQKGWRFKSFLIWFTLSTLYVLALPTLMGATAGYLTPSRAVFKMADGAILEPDSPDLKSCYKVPHGALIGHTNDTIAEGPQIFVYDVQNFWPGTDCHAEECWDEKLRDYPLFASLHNITRFAQSVVYDANDTAPWTTMENFHQTQPYPVKYHGIDQNFTSNITIEGRLYQFRNYIFNRYNAVGEPSAFEESYCYNNETIPSLDAVAECFQERYFVWGFSSLLVYINLSLFMMWLLGMYIVWADARIHSALCRSGRRVGGNLRAVADLSEAMTEVLGNETCAYSDSELARELAKQPGMRYYTSDRMDGVSHIGLSSSSRSRVPYNSRKLYGRAEKDR